MVVQNEGQQEVNAMLAELPPLAVDSMSQVQLTEFIPNLVQLSTGRDVPLFGQNQFKPEWWPTEIPWVDPGLKDSKEEDQIELLRKVVRSCYRHLGQEKLLNDSSSRKFDTMEREQEEAKTTEGATEPPLPVTDTQSAVAASDAPIWVCFLCTKQFSDQDTLMEHQDECEKEAEVREAQNRILEIQRQREVLQRRVPQKYRNFPKFRKRKRRMPYPDINYRPEKPVFIGLLDLMQKPDSEKVEVSPKKEVDSDCEIIEVSFPEAPRTPRTPKSLMSQLSRDTEANSRRRHLSFSGMFSDSESGEELEKKISKSSLLFGIDITSVLGHRVKKHLKIDASIPVVKDYEQYCVGVKKNEFMEKLRSERTYPIVYKKRKKFASKFFHSYKFNSGQRREFMITKKTGLTKRSRELLCCLKDCSVKLTRLKPETIQTWCQRKPKRTMKPQRTFSPIFPMNNQTSTRVDSHLRQILSKPLYGPKSARIKQINENINRIRTSQSMQHYDMITRVVTNPDGTETMKVIYVPKKVQENRRKQTFNPHRKVIQEDEDIQIIELSDSSDDETDQSTLTASPRKCPPQMNRSVVRPSTPQSRTGVLKPTSLSSENLVGRNSPIMKNNQFRPRSGIITQFGIKSPSKVDQDTAKRPVHVTAPGSVPMRDLLPRPLPSSPASRNISYGQVASPLTLRISNPRSLLTNSVSANQVNGMPTLEKCAPEVQTIQADNRSVISAKPNILQRPPIAIAPLKLVSNKPEEAIVIDDDD